MLKKLGISISIVKLIKIAPLDTDRILALTKGASLIYLLEEGIKAGSVSEKIASALCTSQSKGARVIIRAIDDTFVNHGSRDELLEEYSLDSQSIAAEIFNALE
jgi:deoxyxylulose-5-phosphate synthase